MCMYVLVVVWVICMLANLCCLNTFQAWIFLCMCVCACELTTPLSPSLPLLVCILYTGPPDANGTRLGVNRTTSMAWSMSSGPAGAGSGAVGGGCVYVCAPFFFVSVPAAFAVGW